MREDLTVVVLAAGGGTRMRSKTMKVLHPIAGRSMLGHVLAAVRELGPDRIVTVVGTQREQVGPHVRALVPDVLLAVQETRGGTGHAVRVAWEQLAPDQRSGTVLVVCADTPLLETASLAALLSEHADSGDAVSILSGVVADPTGYGRIVREPDGAVRAIVEQQDATVVEAAGREVNSGILAFDAAFLDHALPLLTADNSAGEYLLTDTVRLARESGHGVGAMALDDVAQTEGANDRVQLAALARAMNERILGRWMRSGVTVVDPATTWVDVDVTLAPDVTLLPGTQLLGATAVAEDAVVGPDCTLRDVEVGAGAKVVRTHAELSVIGAGASVGPFSYLRPGTVLGAGGKIGAFVEVKNASIGEGAKVPHLSYVGDAEIGEGTNIGAGTIFANYDGVAKHRTRIGAQVRTGADNTFVAPVEIGDGAATGAGTVVRRDVAAGDLALSAGAQRDLEGWTLRRRPGTPMAEAARAARAEGGPGSEDDTRFAEGGPPGSDSPERPLEEHPPGDPTP